MLTSHPLLSLNCFFARTLSSSLSYSTCIVYHQEFWCIVVKSQSVWVQILTLTIPSCVI